LAILTEIREENGIYSKVERIFSDKGKFYIALYLSPV